MKWVIALHLLPLLQTGRVRQFWDEAAKSRHIVEAIPDMSIFARQEKCIYCTQHGPSFPAPMVYAINSYFRLLQQVDNLDSFTIIIGFKQAIQADTIHVRSLAYQKAINIEGLSLDKFLEHQEANCGWILEKSHGKGQLIVLPHNEFNHPKMKKNTVDSIPLEHITHIFPILG
ncbi:hypothetical protein JRO89_XS04G0142900 [Xanthoceras sorbifolium]|uniref:Uncharacterized protein n=1 Tax=Xanthoceras sorbifolium TaxID=99658 RepID=A0ABQ8I579_9ROSI|nr:hypothetical protein JRO89_XS04G0142900 [Xanthoceras sorbifolium]